MCSGGVGADPGGGAATAGAGAGPTMAAERSRPVSSADLHLGRWRLAPGPTMATAIRRTTGMAIRIPATATPRPTTPTRLTTGAKAGEVTEPPIGLRAGRPINMHASLRAVRSPRKQAGRCPPATAPATNHPRLITRATRREPGSITTTLLSGDTK